MVEKTTEQYGFFFDQSRCSGCRACSVACKNWHNLPPGPLKYLRIYEYEKGTFPDVRLHIQWLPCYHCEKPTCLDICPTKAIYKEEKYGVVLIDEAKCIGCRLCYYACPYGAPVFESDKGEKTFGESWAHVSCSQACPAHIDVPRYVRYVGQGKYAEAVAVIREKIPFPSVCGRVCFHPCETKCERAKIDSPVSIRVLKRYATDHDTGLWRANSKVAPSTGKKVAVVGSGPAGLTAAFYLVKLGHAATVFEALPEAGGMLRFAVPEYRMPGDILDAEIKDIQSVGVIIKTNTKIDSLEKLRNEGFDAVLVAIGTHQSQKLRIPGNDLDGILLSIPFLRDTKLGRPPKIGKRVVIIGGGNVAIDSARSALRLGATDVTIACLESRDAMTSTAEEINAACEEGVILHNSQNFKSIVGEYGHVAGVECEDVKCFGFEKDGRLNVECIENSTHILPADTVIFAIGQRPEIPEGFGVNTAKGNTVKVEYDGVSTGKDGVFAAGDVVTGTKFVIDAIAAGRQAASTIDRYLGGTGRIDEILAPAVKMEPLPNPAEKTKHQDHAPMLAPGERIKNFAEAELPLDKQTAIDEAQRCLQCDPVKAHKCTMCIDRLESGLLPMCVLSCPDRALDFGPIKTLIDKYGNRRDLEDLPDSKTTNPAVVFKPHAPKRKLVVYNAKKALELLMKRGDLPPVYTSPDDVTDIPEGTVGRDRLVIKHDSAADLMARTQNDES
jgi:NADPH-dependent glutamate synthase beta subunit-like oxidoreductase/formate hydrogenlyase subunit 6/NADH:ubiquinone oxidoreductase subunit I